jgi:hypothetical protein
MRGAFQKWKEILLGARMQVDVHHRELHVGRSICFAFLALFFLPIAVAAANFAFDKAAPAG